MVEGIISPVSRDDDDVVSFHFGLLVVEFCLFSCFKILCNFVHFYQDTTFADAGSYQVQLTSVVPPNNHIIYFEVDVVENACSDFSESNDGFLIGLICLAIYAVIVSALAVGMYFHSSQEQSKKGNLLLPENFTKCFRIESFRVNDQFA